MSLENMLDDEIDRLHRETSENPTSMRKWDLLFDKLDAKFNQLYSQDPNGISDDFKLLVYKCYDQLLKRFPYLTKYWKSWQLFEFKLNGTDKSIEILANSVKEFPTCINLWTEYLSALISQLNADKSQNALQIEFIRLNYQQAITYNGYNYNSQSLWDKILEFETSIDPTSQTILELYLKLIRIPLYLYAQYFKQFIEINKNFDIAALMSPMELDEYVTKFNKSSSGEFSLIERHQIIDDFCYRINTKTQEQALLKWNYESTITKQEFSVNASDDEYEKWLNYLNDEISTFFKDSTAIESVYNLFERALVPYCYKTELWLKYLAFIHKLDSGDVVDKSSSIFQRAIKVLPLDETQVKFTYGKFLFKYEKYDQCLEYLIETISGYNDKKVYMKQQYMDTMKQLTNVVEELLDKPTIQKLYGAIIQSYFSKQDLSKTTITEGIVQTNSFNAKLLDLIPGLLNGNSISIIVVTYLDKSLDSSEDNEATIRKFYNKYSHESCLQNSVAFWKFYVEYEGLINRNLTNLQQVITKIKTNTQLPQNFIDLFIDLNYDIVSANLLEVSDVSYPLFESIILKDSDKSTSLVHNICAKKRLSNSSYYKDAKNYNQSSKDQRVLKIARKHASHPGVFLETTPDITNKLVSKGVSLMGAELEVPSFPTFKNVEKASLPINFPHE
jgi:pre-mRNA-processing factor 39